MNRSSLGNPAATTTHSSTGRALWREFRSDARSLFADPGRDYKAVVTLVASLVLVIAFRQWGRPGFFYRVLLDPWLALFSLTREYEYAHLFAYWYWALASVILRVLVPAVIVWLVFRERLRDYGFRLQGVTRHALIYPALFGLMIPVLFAVSFTGVFQAKYPLDRYAILGWDHFMIYQAAYGIQFVGVEAFFRGFMVFALFPRFGYYSLLIMVVPYTMIHFGKPTAEIFAAVPAGLLLGYLAVKSRSWVYGAMLHWLVGITMDLMAIGQQGGFRG